MSPELWRFRREPQLRETEAFRSLLRKIEGWLGQEPSFYLGESCANGVRSSVWGFTHPEGVLAFRRSGRVGDYLEHAGPEVRSDWQKHRKIPSIFLAVPQADEFLVGVVRFEEVPPALGKVPQALRLVAERPTLICRNGTPAAEPERIDYLNSILAEPPQFTST